MVATSSILDRLFDRSIASVDASAIASPRLADTSRIAVRPPSPAAHCLPVLHWRKQLCCRILLRVALLLPRAGGGGAGGGGGGIGDAALARELFEEVLAPPTAY